MIYINRKEGNQLETVDELNRNDFESSKEFRKELNRLLNEYQTSDPSGKYYKSSRACQDWK